eukprot:3261174-Pyramimonas_sp.AAC.2
MLRSPRTRVFARQTAATCRSLKHKRTKRVVVDAKGWLVPRTCGGDAGGGSVGERMEHEFGAVLEFDVQQQPDVQGGGVYDRKRRYRARLNLVQSSAGPIRGVLIKPG